MWLYYCKSVNCIGGGSCVISQNDFGSVKKLNFSEYFSNFAMVILFLINYIIKRELDIIFISHGMLGMHGKFCLSPTDNTDVIDFLPFFSPSVQRPLVSDLTIFIKILFTPGIRKINFTSALAYNKIRSFATQKSLYG